MPRPTAAMILSGIASSEGFLVIIGLSDDLVDGCLEIGKRIGISRVLVGAVELAKKPATVLSHEQEVGVMWKMKREWRSGH